MSIVLPMKETSGHIVITGTGRAGTSFLVRYFTELGFDTHISRRGASSWDDDANAGLEDLPIGPAAENLPHVVKSAWIFDHIDQILNNPKFKIDLAVLPVRNLVEAATSRTILELRAIRQQTEVNPDFEIGTTWGRTPGGTVFSLHPMDQARILAVGFHLLVQRFTEAEIPLLFLAFPRLVQDWEYLFRSLQPHLPPGISAADARRAHERTADLRKVRVGTEIATATASDAIKVTQPGLTYPPHRELDRIALQREIERLDREQRKLSEAASEQVQTIADLRTANEQFRDEAVQARAALAAETEARQRLASELAQRETEMRHLTSNLERECTEQNRLKDIIEKLYRSRSWRLTRIFRDLHMIWRKAGSSSSP